MTVVHAIDRAWISIGGTGARNYDEFADDAEITEIIAANPDSALSVEMPHCAPERRGQTFTAALPDAARRLARQRAEGRYVPADQAIALYRISSASPADATATPADTRGKPADATISYGLFATVDTGQISTSADEPGLVIRNEDVFLDKVRERVALADAIKFLLSPVLLLQTGGVDAFHRALEVAAGQAGLPAVTDIDHYGRTHAIWPMPASSPTAARLLELAGGGELVVADGNHRSLAAQLGGLSRFLAVITTPRSVTIQPYHRLVNDLPVPAAAMYGALRTAGATLRTVTGPPAIPIPGEIVLYARDGARAVTLPRPAGAGESAVSAMDHAVVERVLFGDVLGLEPGDKRITYIGGDYPPSWLASEVDAGRADLAVLIAPVAVEQFVAVNLARQKMPRKSTWFTPKARGGLVLAQL